MDFAAAAVAMIDEDQKDAVKAFFDKLTELYLRIFDKYLDYFPRIDAFCIHDDWGSQRETFISPATVSEMIVPYMKRVTDYLHSKGKICELHCCGNVMKQVPNIIAAGWDTWQPQNVNDTDQIYNQYGDRIIIGVSANAAELSGKSEVEQKAAARAYANKYCNPEKPSVLNFFDSMIMPLAFRAELYKQSRINYSASIPVSEV
jgi:hypothetical protein